MKAHHVVLLALLCASCAAPTLAQRQDNWRLYQGSVRATCLVGAARDPAMPGDVREWCQTVVVPMSTVVRFR